MAASKPLKFEGMFPRMTLISCVLIGVLFVGAALLAGIVWAMGASDSPHMAAFVFGMAGFGGLCLVIAYLAYRRWMAVEEELDGQTRR